MDQKLESVLARRDDNFRLAISAGDVEGAYDGDGEENTSDRFKGVIDGKTSQGRVQSADGDGNHDLRACWLSLFKRGWCTKRNEEGEEGKCLDDA